MTTQLRNEVPLIAKRENILYLDVLRITAIYLVILLHALNPWLTAQEIYNTLIWKAALLISPIDRMGVPLFFMLSGYLILSDPRTLDIASFYKRRLPRILIPFLVWNIIYYVVYTVIGGEGLSVVVFLKEILKQNIKYHFWYIYTLVGMYVFAPFLKRMIDGCTKKQSMLLLFLILLPVTIFPFIHFFTNVWVSAFPTMMEGYLGFFVLGYLLGNWPVDRKYKWILYAAGIAAWLGGAWGNYISSTAEQINVPFNTGYNLVHYLTAGAFFVLVQSMSDQLALILPVKWIKYWAGLTFGIYLCHVLVMDLWYGVISFSSPALTIFASFVSTSVLSTLCMAVVSLIKPIKKFLM